MQIFVPETRPRLNVATLKLYVRSRKVSIYVLTAFHLERLKELTCAHEYTMSLRSFHCS